jgi:hypothetical protein
MLEIFIENRLPSKTQKLSFFCQVLVHTNNVLSFEGSAQSHGLGFLAWSKTSTSLI